MKHTAMEFGRIGLETKVLVIGHYRENSGFGEATRRYIYALNAAGVDVVCRPIKLSASHTQIDELLLECEKKDSRGCDVIIQNVLPHHMSYSGRFEKNIAQLMIDGSGYKNSAWYTSIETLDEAWLANSSMERPNVPSSIVPVPCDAETYRNTYEPLHIDSVADSFVFYTIADWNRRKNLAATLIAFHSEFDQSEPVSLIIKTGQYGKPTIVLQQEVSQFCSSIKQGLKLYRNVEDYHNEVVITDHLSPPQVMGLHTVGDCYVNSSYAESWCLPAFDAMAMSNYVVSSDEGGPKDFLKDLAGCYLVGGQYEPCFDGQAAFDFLLTGRQSWFNINVGELRKAMRLCYTKASEPSLTERQERTAKYSYEKIGKWIKTLLMK